MIKIDEEKLETKVNGMVTRILERKGITQPEFLTTKETMAELGVTFPTICKYIKHGNLNPLPKVHAKSKLLFNKNEVLQFKLVQPKNQ
jgi:hypothetical protein